MQRVEQEYAFLLENQWRVPLPKVLEKTPGATPRELVIYLYDMIPFHSDLRDPETQIPRQDVDRYIQTELIPEMLEVYEDQSNLWLMPWYEEWHSYRTDEGPKTLSVALNEFGTWFHGTAPSLGHSMISIRVGGSFVEYENIMDGLISVFEHELFHNQQRNFSLHYGGNGNISGREQAWKLYSEGTAVLASLVGRPAVQLAPSTMPRSYLKRANAFIGSEGISEGGLNTSYRDIPYNTALYWRFLYEQCGGMHFTAEDPSSGMQVIRHVLETVYSSEYVDINSSTSAVENFPRIIDAALEKTPVCPFHSYEESLIQFSRAIYLLRRVEGRCMAIHPFSTCGFFDPDHLYSVPDTGRYDIVSNRGTVINGSIQSSFGIDLMELSLDPSMEGKSLRIIFKSTASPEHIYNIEFWTKSGFYPEYTGGRYKVTQNGPILSAKTSQGSLTYEIESLHLDEFHILDLVITRMDTYENALLPGQYVIQVVME